MAQVTQLSIDETQGEGSGNTVRLLVNSLFSAIVTQHSGPTPPPDPYPNLEWKNTNDNTLYQRDETNSAWLVRRTFDRVDIPTASNNELTNFAPGAEWYTTTGRAFKHVGRGVWAELGEVQAASLFAPTIGVLGGKRFAGSSDGTLNAVVSGGPRFALGVTAPIPAPSRFDFGLTPSIRLPIPHILSGDGPDDPQPFLWDSFSYPQFLSTTTGLSQFEFPILTAPTYLLLKLTHFLASGAVGTIPWVAATSRLQNMSAVTFGSDTIVTTTSLALGLLQTTQILLHSAGAGIGDILRVRFNRSGGTAGTILLTNVTIEQNP